jgi:hypothetical protein
MPGERLSMRKIRELLRLRWEHHLPPANAAPDRLGADLAEFKWLLGHLIHGFRQPKFAEGSLWRLHLVDNFGGSLDSRFRPSCVIWLSRRGYSPVVPELSHCARHQVLNSVTTLACLTICDKLVAFRPTSRLSPSLSFCAGGHPVNAKMMSRRNVALIRINAVRAYGPIVAAIKSRDSDQSSAYRRLWTGSE